MSHKSMSHISMVKKIKLDGTVCRKCADVMERLNNSGLIQQIDRVIIADERDPESEGMHLAQKHNVDSAPFFIVASEATKEQIYTAYFKFVRDVLQKPVKTRDELMELAASNPALDYI